MSQLPKVDSIFDIIYDMTISVIIPVYKVEKYLDQCVDSVVNQSYRSLEIILVDDGSPDSCPAKCDAWASRDERIQVIHKQNGGASSARNVGLEIATGEYVYFLDSDDYLPDTALSVLSNALNDTPRPQVVIGCIKPIPMDKNRVRYYDLSYRNVPYSYRNSTEIREKFFSTKESLPINCPNKLMERQFLLDHQLYCKEGIIHEDEHWAFRMYRQLERVTFVKECTYIHPVIQGSVMSSLTSERSASSWRVIFDDLLSKVTVHDESYQLYYSYLLRIFLERYYRWHALPVFKDVYGAFFRKAFHLRLYKHLFCMLLVRVSVWCGCRGRGIIQRLVNKICLVHPDR